MNGLRSLMFAAWLGITAAANHALLFPGRVAMMNPGGSIVTGNASDVISDATLSATYGIGIAVFSLPRRAGPGELKFCSPW